VTRAGVRLKMSGLPEVSVVVVGYKSRDLVLRCLRTLAEHAGMRHEVIVVDDASGDGTPEAVRDAFPKASVLAKSRNEGLAAGRNAALPLIRGRLVLMLDSDTRVRPGALEAMADVLDRNPRVGLVGPKLVYPDGRVQLSCRRWQPLLTPFVRRGPYARINPNPRLHQLQMMEDFDHATERPVVWVMGAAQMWRTELPREIGRFDERISSYGGEDWDWCARVWEAGQEVRYVPRAEIVHDWQKVVRHSAWSRHSLRALRDFYYLQWKHRRLRRDRRLAAASA
jgi:N-acetylglucosaminyl-diphospho-decaprenol L-rhamnosyltransferase